MLDPQHLRLFVLAGGAIPYEIANWVDIAPRNLLPLPGSIFTSMFLHGGWMHLSATCGSCGSSATTSRTRMGDVRFVIFYLVSARWARLPRCFSMPGVDVADDRRVGRHRGRAGRLPDAVPARAGA